ncbi:solute carrier family 22 member 13-like [Notolabrus celidotus]|uniref:solute carrier family 22 member 13-like n=1 Tax=Notolabrus celidotus TaxID=1203425 RepID=UPI00148F7C0A|nr:solute carrier family 22 member 13-like [Notolabrus celidotus]
MSNFGEILKEVGEFGSFQKRLLAALCMPSFFVAFDIIGQVFTGRNFEHNCNTDWILEQGPNLTEDRQRNLTLPLNKDGQFESCIMFTPVDLDLETIEAYGINKTTSCIDGWDYQASNGASSSVTDFDLVCDQSGLIEVSQSVYMAGYMVGAVTYGAISDRFGRRFAVLLSLFIVFSFGVGLAFSPNIYVFLVLKFFCGTSGGVMVMNTSVLALEWTDPSKAAVCTVLLIIIYGVGLMLLSGLAFLIPNWRILQLVLSGPVLPVLIFLYWFLPESARWYLSNGKKEEAQKMLERAARVNRRKVPYDLLDQVDMKVTTKRRNMFHIFRIPYLRKRTIIMGFNWFATSLLYYGLSLNVGGFGLNIYLTQFIFGFVEIPANLGSLLLIQHFGRRICHSCFLIFGGVSCLLTLAIPKDLPVVVTVIAVLGKMAATTSFSTAYVYTAELYPTVLRQNGVGLNSMCARMAGIFAPLIRLLDVFHHTIPMIIYGIIPIAAGGFCWLLPETLNVQLQDHAEEKKTVNGHIGDNPGQIIDEHKL